jgi:hypothetical protein
MPGDEVWVEDPGYPLTHAQLLLAKARPHAIPVDAQGLVVDAGVGNLERPEETMGEGARFLPVGTKRDFVRRPARRSPMNLSILARDGLISSFGKMRAPRTRNWCGLAGIERQASDIRTTFGMPQSLASSAVSAQLTAAFASAGASLRSHSSASFFQNPYPEK